MYLSPAEYVISVFGGVRKTAYAIGRSPTSVCKWKQPKKDKGCGGGIPRLAQNAILAVARSNRLDITPDDLINGRNVKA